MDRAQPPAPEDPGATRGGAPPHHGAEAATATATTATTAEGAVEARRARFVAIATAAVAEVRATYGEALAVATITGSVARGRVDRHSDVDVCLLFDVLPDAEAFARERDRAVASGGGLYGGDPEQGWALHRRADGAKLDLAFSRFADVEALLADVVERADLDLTKQLILDGLRRSRPLHGAGRLRGLLARADPYPEALGRAMISHHLRFRPAWVWRGMGADRGDRLFLAEEFLALASSLFGVCCGLNGVYHPGKLKGLGTADGPAFALAPERLGERLASLFRREPHDAVAEAERLVAETLDLVERARPDIPVEEVRRRVALDAGTAW